MRYNTLQQQVPAESPRHVTAAFGYNHSRVATLRLAPHTNPGLRPTVRARSLWATILAVLAACGRPDIREGLATEVFRAAFAGFAIFGGALLFVCNLGIGVAYVAVWIAFGAVRHVVEKMNEAPHHQQVLAMYSI